MSQGQGLQLVVHLSVAVQLQSGVQGAMKCCGHSTVVLQYYLKERKGRQVFRRPLELLCFSVEISFEQSDGVQVQL